VDARHDPGPAVRLAGKLQDVTFPGLLQMLAVRRRTGKLTVTCRDAMGVVVLRHGLIIYAATNSAREMLGNLLVCNGLVDEATLSRALELQHESGGDRRLGSVLVELGAISAGALETMIKQQTTVVMREMFGWEQGFFAFDPVDVPDGGEVAVDARDLVMESGLNPGELIHDLLDALNFETQPVQFPGPRPGECSPKPGEPTLASLNSIINELRSPSFGGEITAWLLRYAGTVVRRRVLFSISNEGIRGMGHAGLDALGEEASERVRRILIPAGETSVFQHVVESRTSYSGPLFGKGWDGYLVEQLGGSRPAEVAAVPMVVNRNAVAILYGDNLPDHRRIGPIDGLELLMLEAGLAMEKTALEVRLRTLQERLGHR